jgi:hypothetical protein
MIQSMRKKLMQVSSSLKQLSFSILLAALAGLSFAGCESAKEKPAAAATASAPATPGAPVAPTAPATPTAPAVPATPSVPAASAKTSAAQAPPVRIKAGYFSSFKDSEGNTWLPDQSFAGGGHNRTS